MNESERWHTAWAVADEDRRRLQGQLFDMEQERDASRRRNELLSLYLACVQTWLEGEKGTRAQLKERLLKVQIG